MKQNRINNESNFCEEVSFSESNKKILLVDDDRVPRYYARRVLEAEGYEVLESNTGDDALAILLAQDIDLVLLDINMPGKDGYETCQLIRHQVKNTNLPVIIVSGQDDHDSIERAYQAGATDFNSKPVNWTIFKNRIRLLIQNTHISTQLKIHQHDMKSLWQLMPEAILRINNTGKLLELKHEKQIYGPILAMINETDIEVSLPGEIIEMIKSAVSRALSGEADQLLEFELHESGNCFNYELCMTAVNDNEVLALLRDITKRRRDEALARYIAYYDEITGLHSFTYVLQKLRQYQSHATKTISKLAVVRIDIAEFGYMYNMLGKVQADRLLRLWTSRLSNEVNRLCEDKDEMHVLWLGRVKDSGFVIVLDGVRDETELKEYVVCLEKKMNETLVLGNYELNVVMLAGMSVYVQSMVTDAREQGVEALIVEAEASLEKARKSVNSHYSVYSSNVHDRKIGDVSLALDLQLAIENGELYLDYQPKISTSSGSLVGVEALIRWQHDRKGLLMPETIIPLAEESNLMLGLGEFVMNEACHQKNTWYAEGFHNVSVAVNFSAHQFHQRGLFDVIQNTLSTHSIVNGQLEIEVPESVAIQNSSRINKILNEFRSNGIKTTVDNFGIALSSLDFMNDCIFDAIKINRDYIKGLNKDNNAALIIEAVINMGHAHDMRIVAKGVESQQQYQVLKDMKCDAVQGYFTGRPMSADEIRSQYFVP